MSWRVGPEQPRYGPARTGIVSVARRYAGGARRAADHAEMLAAPEGTMAHGAHAKMIMAPAEAMGHSGHAGMSMARARVPTFETPRVAVKQLGSLASNKAASDRRVPLFRWLM
jgi:hypothetical protein